MQSPKRQIKNANPNRQIAKFLILKQKKHPFFRVSFFIDFDLLTFAKLDTSSVELRLLFEANHQNLNLEAT